MAKQSLEVTKGKKAPRKLGRPSKYSQQLSNVICERLVEGESLRKICLDEDMPSVATIFNWFSMHKDFLEQYTRAKENQADTYADEIVYISDTEPDPNKARVRIESRKWVAAKLKAKKYGDKLDLTSDGKELPAPILNFIAQTPQADTTHEIIDGEIVEEVPEITALHQPNPKSDIMDSINGI